MNEKIKELLDEALRAVAKLESEMSIDLKGKSFTPDESNPLRALQNIREAKTSLGVARIKLENFSQESSNRKNKNKP